MKLACINMGGGAMNKIEKILQNEDIKNPLTDEKIASMLKINREDVTEYRRIKNILDSRERRKPYLYDDIKKILVKNRKISDRKLTMELNNIGYQISRFTISQMKKEILEVGDNVEEDGLKFVENVKNNKKLEEIEKSDKEVQCQENAFEEIIGYDTSLKMQISQAKAAVLYPPRGLHTLILGPSGIGKSQLAEAMYKFAIASNRLTGYSPFIVFNCADYADNPQLLMAQLFGYSKGSFTGADAEKAGLVEKANGGILFLDEVHRLTNEGQEMLFYLLDKGKFRRLGETEMIRKSQIMIIAATTENPDSSLLLTFRRRIPMTIELPPLDERPFSERYKIIKYFFTQESLRINRRIKVKSDAIRALMLYNCPGNIGQIRSDIQVACARGFLNALDSKNENTIIDMSNLPNHIRMSLLTVNDRDPNIEEYIYKDMITSFDEKSRLLSREDRYILPNEIYQFIEDRFNQLKEQGYLTKEINKIVGSQVEIELKRFAKHTKTNTVVSKKELCEIVGDKIICAVEDAIEIAKKYYEDISENFFYSFAIHLSATYDRLKFGKSIINPQLEIVRKEYKREYSVAKKMVDSINKDLEIKLTDDEVGFVAMYLRTFSCSKNKSKENVGVIVITHGHVAKGMAEVANKLLGVNIAQGIEMDLDEKPEDALMRTIEVVKKVDAGKGCLILIDMGSLITFGEIITKRTGIPTRTLGRVDTVMVLEAVRRAILPEVTLDDIANSLDMSKAYVGHVEGVKDSYKLPKAIVTICITGEGTAIKLKEYITHKLMNIIEGLNIIPIGVFNEHEIEDRIATIKSQYNLIAFIGTINPKVNEIPFIPVEEIMSREGLEKLKQAIQPNKNRIIESQLDEIITEDLILVNVKLNNKNDILDEMIRLAEEKGYVDKGFMLSVYKRELLAPTWMEGGIALPHGNTKYVKKSSIVIAKLDEPVYWEGKFEADLIFLIALKEDSRNYMVDLYKVLKEKDNINALRKAKSVKKIKQIILKNTMPAR